MRLIDADQLAKEHKEVHSLNMKFNLDLAPTVDAELAVYGRWIPYNSDWPKQGGGYQKYWICSICGRKLIATNPNDFPYCHCGAKMQLEN